jgi:hypothetical protein
MDPPPADPPAPIELLDQDTRPPARGSHWERWIGLALVLGLAAFGLAQWWGQSTQQSAYRAGVRAESTHDWDAAAAAYGQAGEYRDARAQATHAAAQAGERDSAVEAAGTAVARQDWNALLAARDRLQKVVPDSADLPRYTQLIHDQLYMPALSGTVALRPKAQPPGWYTYHDGDWRWLHGSDPQSRIEAHCPGGGWLLDVPGSPAESVPASPVPTSADDYARRMAGRRLAVVNADGSLRLTLAPAMATGMMRLCDTRQAWNIGYVTDLPQIENSFYPVMNVITATYQRFDSPRAEKPHLPGPAWYILYPSGDGAHLWVVDLTGATSHTSQTRLYVAASDGSDLRFMGLLDGNIVGGEFSADGHYGSVLTNEVGRPDPTTGAIEQIRRLYLLDVRGQRPTHILAQVRVATGTVTDGLDTNGGFVAYGPYRGRLILLQCRDDTEQISLIDPDHPDRKQTMILPHRVYNGYLARFDAQGGILLAGARGPGPGSDPLFVYIDAQHQVHEFYPSSLAYKGIMLVRIRQGRAVYMDGSIYTDGNSPGPADLFSLTLGRFGDAGVAPTPLYIGVLPPSQDPYNSLTPWTLGPEFLLYAASNGDLHAERYDGSGDVVIDHDVAGFEALYVSLFGEP